MKYLEATSPLVVHQKQTETQQIPLKTSQEKVGGIKELVMAGQHLRVRPSAELSSEQRCPLLDPFQANPAKPAISNLQSSQKTEQTHLIPGRGGVHKLTGSQFQ